MSMQDVEPKELTPEQAFEISKAFSEWFTKTFVSADPDDYLEAFYIGFSKAVYMADKYGLDSMKAIVKFFEEEDSEQ